MTVKAATLSHSDQFVGSGSVIRSTHAACDGDGPSWCNVPNMHHVTWCYVYVTSSALHVTIAM